MKKISKENLSFVVSLLIIIGSVTLIIYTSLAKHRENRKTAYDYVTNKENNCKLISIIEGEDRIARYTCNGVDFTFSTSIHDAMKLLNNAKENNK